MFIPPGGAAGFVQMTPASRLALTRGTTRTAASPRRKRRRASKAAAPKRRAKASGRKMKFGSPAWQKKYKVGKYRK